MVAEDREGVAEIWGREQRNAYWMIEEDGSLIDRGECKKNRGKREGACGGKGADFRTCIGCIILQTLPYIGAGGSFFF